MRTVSRTASAARGRAGFSLIEILVASAVLLMLLGFALSTVSRTSDIWQNSAQKITAFQSARAGFERLTRQLSQATLNTYWTYDDPNDPQQYVRHSELHFRTGPGLLGTSHALVFQAPASRTENPAAFGGLERLLNGCGFFIDYVDEEIPDPLVSAVPPRQRFRLMQWMQNTENLKVYDPAAADPDAWYAHARAEGIPVADNVIALILWPKLSDRDIPPAGWADSYAYDSRQGTPASQPVKMHQLPPVVQVAMVAIDSRSADRLGDSLKPEIDAALNGLFAELDSGDPRKSLHDDLAELEKRLREKKITYRVFESAVPLREAKWSKE